MKPKPYPYKCKCGNPDKTGMPRHLCHCCLRREKGWEEWLVERFCPKDEVYLKLRKGVQNAGNRQGVHLPKQDGRV